MVFPEIPVQVPIILALLAGMILSHVLMRSLRSFMLKRRFRRGACGEVEAERYLYNHGFTVIEKQVEKKARLQVDGENREYCLRADFLAIRKGKRCIIEAKTGAKAVDPLYTETRRQLFEYATVYDVDRVYLYDAEKKILHEVWFPMVKTRWRGSVACFLTGLFAGLSAGAVMLMLR
jgi:hypothetical protein